MSRTPHRWLLAGLFALACRGSSSPAAAPPARDAAVDTAHDAVRDAAVDDPDVAPTPTEVDAQILRRADALLSDPSKWRHGGDRDCDDHAQSWNLYCVLRQASVDVTGAFEHRGASLQEVRWVVDERTRGVDLQHRLMDYNNLPTTGFDDIKSVLATALQRLEAKLAAAPR